MSGPLFDIDTIPFLSCCNSGDISSSKYLSPPSKLFVSYAKIDTSSAKGATFTKKSFWMSCKRALL